MPQEQDQIIASNGKRGGIWNILLETKVRGDCDLAQYSAVLWKCPVPGVLINGMLMGSDFEVGCEERL